MLSARDFARTEKEAAEHFQNAVYKLYHPTTQKKKRKPNMETKPTTPIKDQPISIPTAYPSLSQEDREALLHDLASLRDAVIDSNSQVNEISVHLGYIVNKFMRKEFSEFDFGYSICDLSHKLNEASKNISAAQSLSIKLYQKI